MAKGAFTEYAMRQITARVTLDSLMIRLGHAQSQYVQWAVSTEAVARYGNFVQPDTIYLRSTFHAP